MRYILFGGSTYYPLGGADDIVATALRLEEITPTPAPHPYVGVWEWILKAQNEPRTYMEWWHIYDTAENKVVVASGPDSDAERAGAKVMMHPDVPNRQTN